MRALALAVLASCLLAGAVPEARAGGTADVTAAPACRGSDGYAADFGGRRTFLFRPDWLKAVKASGPAGPAAAAWQATLAKADAALVGPVYSVTDKTRVPPSGDKHDYISMGPYWWPDPASPSAPYVRRDGEINPERNGPGFDVTRADAMSDAVEALAMAYWLTDDRRYAVKAAELVRVWFLDPKTAMNPSLDYSQGVPGRYNGRAEGVLDGYRLLKVTEGVGLIAPAGVLSHDEQGALEDWFGKLVVWMAMSDNGKAERAAKNNHALWYDLQLTAFSLFARADKAAAAVVAAAPARLAAQIEPDGRMPEELSRTRALHYSTFALQAAANLAQLAPCVGGDLWGWRSADGRSLRGAVGFLAPYAGRTKDFPYPDLRPDETAELYEVLLLAGWAYRDEGFTAQALKEAPRNAALRLNLRLPPYPGGRQ